MGRDTHFITLYNTPIMYQKLILACALLTTSFAAHAQFELTSEGFIDGATHKKYVVYEFENQSVEQLYESTYSYLLENRLVITDSIQTPRTNMIRMVITHPQTLDFGIWSSYRLRYDLIVRFKGNKIRIEAPMIEGYFYSEDSATKQILKHRLLVNENQSDSNLNTSYLFNRKEKPNKKNRIAPIEQVVNEQIFHLVTYLYDEHDGW